jgi:hypothetical protein
MPAHRGRPWVIAIAPMVALQWPAPDSSVRAVPAARAGQASRRPVHDREISAGSPCACSRRYPAQPRRTRRESGAGTRQNAAVCRTQDRQADIDEKRGVGRRWRCGVAGRHDEVVDAPATWRVEAGRIERLHGPLRRARFVIVVMHVIHSVVEPQRQFDFMELPRLGVQFFEQREALPEMLQRMVVALRFAPGSQQALELAGGQRQVQLRPQRLLVRFSVRVRDHGRWLSVILFTMIAVRSHIAGFFRRRPL